MISLDEQIEAVNRIMGEDSKRKGTIYTRKPLDTLINDINATYKTGMELADNASDRVIERLKGENMKLKKEIKFLKLPLNERLEQEYILKREQEDSKEVNNEVKQ